MCCRVVERAVLVIDGNQAGSFLSTGFGYHNPESVEAITFGQQIVVERFDSEEGASHVA